MKIKIYSCEWVEFIIIVCSVIGLAVIFSRTGTSLGTDMVFVGSVLLVMVWRRVPMANVGLRWSVRRQDMLVLVTACSVSALVLFLSHIVLSRTGLGWLLPVKAMPDNKLAWVFSQFFQVALCEELFFRGYVQGSIRLLLKPVFLGRDRVSLVVSIAFSAGVFAVAHCLVWGHWVGMMTFFSGLMLGWVFWRTGGLLEPVLYHGLANMGYVMLLSKGAA